LQPVDSATRERGVSGACRVTVAVLGAWVSVVKESAAEASIAVLNAVVEEACADCTAKLRGHPGIGAPAFAKGQGAIVVEAAEFIGGILRLQSRGSRTRRGGFLRQCPRGAWGAAGSGGNILQLCNHDN